MRFSLYLFLSLLVSLSVLFSCSKEADPRLSYIASIVDDNPDAAIDSLGNIEPDRLSNPDRHLYDFLEIKSKDKAYVTHTSDSLILDVIGHYSKGGDRSMYAEALYYGGRVYSDLGDYPTALKYFQQALDELPEKEKGSGLESRIVSQTGSLYNTLMLYDEARPFIERAMEINKLNKDTLNWVYNLQLLGNLYLRDENYFEAEKIIAETYPLLDNLPPYVKAYSQLYMSEIYANTNREELALHTIKGIENFIDNKAYNYSLEYAASVYMKAGIHDSAYEYSVRLINSERPELKEHGYYMLLSKELAPYSTPDSIISYAQNFVINFKDYDKSVNNVVLLQQSRYNYSGHELRAQKISQTNRHLKLSMLILAFVAVLLICIFLFINLQKNKKILNLHRAIESFDNIKAPDQDNPVKIMEKKEKTEDELREELREKMLSCDFENKNIKVDQNLSSSEPFQKLTVYIEKEQAVNDSDELWHELKKQIETSSPNFFDNLTLLASDRLTKTDIQTLLLIKYGISSSDMTKILSRTHSTIGSRKDSLCLKLFGKKIPNDNLDNIIKII